MTADPLLSIVVDRAEDAALLRAVLPGGHLERMRFYAAAGRVGLATVGRNILVHEGGPLLVVMDADTRDAGRADELRSVTGVALRNVAPGGSLDVFAFLPEIEVIFFEAPAALERSLGRALPAETLREGLLAPRATLARILAANGRGAGLPAFADTLDPQTVEIIREGPQARALLDSIAHLLEPAGRS